MPRLPRENIYVARCIYCHKLILLSGDELLQTWEAQPEKNHQYRFKCPGCDGKSSLTTTELLMDCHNKYECNTWDVPFDSAYIPGHPIIVDEP